MLVRQKSIHKYRKSCKETLIGPEDCKGFYSYITKYVLKVLYFNRNVPTARLMIVIKLSYLKKYTKVSTYVRIYCRKIIVVLEPGKVLYLKYY